VLVPDVPDQPDLVLPVLPVFADLPVSAVPEFLAEDVYLLFQPE
jgi:hypothetical protein